MRIALIDSPRLTCWRDVGHRLSAIADGSGFTDGDAILVGVADARGLPVLAGYGREADVVPLIDASRVVSSIKHIEPDLCIAPLRGGLAHGVLMARACGELPPTLRVALIAEESSKSIALRSNSVSAWLRPLVSDALERFCLQHADALLTSTEQNIDDLQQLVPAGLPPQMRDFEVALEQSILLRGEQTPRELTFIGAFTRAANVVAFIEIVERLFARRPRSFDRVSFIGPMPDGARAAGREWLGRRAANWCFRFKVVETDSLNEAVSRACDVKAPLIYAPDFPTACLSFFEGKGLRRHSLTWAVERDPARLESAFVDIQEGATIEIPRKSAQNLRGRVAQIKCHDRPVNRSDTTCLSVCILHKDRPLMLAQAVDSVRRQIEAADRHRIELLVYDNGSESAHSARMLAELPNDPLIKVVRSTTSRPNPTAMNAMAKCAAHSFVAFLDDDNMLADGGLAALLRACASGAFDVIASNLFIIDSDRMEKGPVAKFAFIGPARSAGLFFNGFGDTSMVFRRTALEHIGGFLDTNAPTPGPDWILLARAQAAGLRIGVLQEPAFLYRRDVSRADLSWQKYDQHGVRSLVLQNYGNSYDAALVARLCQTLAIDFL